MATHEHGIPRPEGEAGSGTVSGDHIGTGGVTGGTGAFGVEGGAPPRTQALGTANTAGGEESAGIQHTPRQPSERALANEVHERTVVPEARWGVDSGSPSGGTSGGTPSGPPRGTMTGEEE